MTIDELVRQIAKEEARNAVAAHEQFFHQGPNPPDPPDPPDPPPSSSVCRHPAFPYVNDGLCVELGGRIYNTRYRTGTNFARDMGDHFEISQNNATATYVPEWSTGRGGVRFTAIYRGGILDDIEGGNHYHQINSFHRAHSRGTISDTAPQFRIELANLGSRPRIICWKYNTGDREDVRTLNIEPLSPNQDYEWAMEYEYESASGSLTFTLGLNGLFTPFVFVSVPNTHSFRYFFPMGHIGPQMGYVEYRDVQFYQP